MIGHCKDHGFHFEWGGGKLLDSLKHNSDGIWFIFLKVGCKVTRMETSEESNAVTQAWDEDACTRNNNREGGSQKKDKNLKIL